MPHFLRHSVLALSTLCAITEWTCSVVPLSAYKLNFINWFGFFTLSGCGNCWCYKYVTLMFAQYIKVTRFLDS